MLTAGADLEDFKKNPLLLWNHTRPNGNETDQILPLGYWDDLEVKNGSITGVPVFDDTDEFAKKIYGKVENGTLKMCSAGAEPIETSNDPTLLSQGQTRETVTKWKLKEASIVDIGANPESLAVALYDKGLNRINLAAGSNNFIPQITLSDMDDNKKKEENLTDDDKKKEVTMSDEDKKKMEELQKENEELKKKLKLQEEGEKEKKSEQLAEKAFDEKKITAKQKEHIIKLANAEYDAAKAYVDSLPAQENLADKFKGNPLEVERKQKRLMELSAKSGKDMFMTGELTELKELDPDLYKLKYEEATTKK